MCAEKYSRVSILVIAIHLASSHLVLLDDDKMLTPDVAVILNLLLEGLVSSDNSSRSAAEQILETEWRSSDKVGLLLTFLAETSANGQNDAHRSFAAVLFRRTAIRMPKERSSIVEKTIGVVEDQVKANVRHILLQGFVSDQSAQVRRKLADAISEVAKEDVSPPGSWPELIPTLFQATQNSNSSFRESAFRILSATPEIVHKDLVQEIPAIFNRGFSDDDDDVRIAACTAFVAFFKDLPKSTWQSLLPLLPNLLNSLPRFLQSGRDEALADVLQALIELIEIAPKMFRDMFPTIIEFCTTVAKNTNLESNTRLAALEIMTTFAEFAPAMCKQSPVFSSSAIIVTLSMLTEVSLDDDEAYEWNNSDNSEDLDDEPEYDAARQSLDRISLKLGGQSLAALLFQYLPSMVQSSNWRECYAALMALSSAAEGCCDVLIAEIPKLLDMVLPSLDHAHPRVQYACCNALGQMSTDFADVIQRTSGNRILPALISKLTNKSVPRVQAHAAAALVNFSEAALKEVVEPYLDDLLNNLLGLLLSPKRYVQEQVLTTIAIIADAAEKKFIKYHDTLIPMLLDFLRSNLGPESRILTAKCVECATLISVAVGRETFSTFSQDLIATLASLQESITEPDDPVKRFLEQGWGRLCRLIGKDFVNFLPLILPPLMSTAKAVQDISLLEENEAEEFQNSHEDWDIITLSGKLVAINTSLLDEKVSAMDLLRLYATQLRGHFMPWVNEIVQDIALPALDFYLHDGVRGSAALTLASLLKCVIDATANDSPEVITLWSQICGHLCDALTNDPVPELLVAYYTALADCITSLGANSISQEQQHMLSNAIKTNLSEIFERIKHREQNEDDFQEEVDDDDDEYTDEELLDEINKILAAIFRNVKSQFMLEFQGNLASLFSTFITDENASLKLCGLSTICDAIENCGQSIDLSTYVQFTVTECLTSPQASIRQAAAYVIGVSAQTKSSVYESLCVKTLPSLFEIATFPDARAEENLNATENCVSAIIKVCTAFESSIPDLQKILHQWIKLLPVTQDEEAATVVYKALGDLISSQNPAVVDQASKVVESVFQGVASGAINSQLAGSITPPTRALLQTLTQEEALTILRNYSFSESVTKLFS